MKVTKKLKDVLRLNVVLTNFVDQKGEEETKLAKSITNVLKQIQPALEKYQEDVEDIRLTHCLTDEKTNKILTTENGGYEYTKDGARAMTKEIKALGDGEVVLHARIYPENDAEASTLNFAEKDVLSGIVITEIIDELEVV